MGGTGNSSGHSTIGGNIKGMENVDAHGLKKETGGWETKSRKTDKSLKICYLVVWGNSDGFRVCRSKYSWRRPGCCI